MCVASTHPGGPKRCSADAERAVTVAQQHSVAAAREVVACDTELARIEADLAVVTAMELALSADADDPAVVERIRQLQEVAARADRPRDRGGRVTETVADDPRPLMWSRRGRPEEALDFGRIETVADRDWLTAKPLNGLWLGPLDDDADCTEWEWLIGCNDYDRQPMTRIEVALAPNANTFRLRTLDDLRYLEETYPAAGDSAGEALMFGLHYRPAHVDWAAVAADYDVFHLTESGVAATANSNPGLGGWDVESVVVLNPGVAMAAKDPVVVDPPAGDDPDDEGYRQFLEVMDLADNTQGGR